MTQRIARLVSLVLGLILGLATMAHAEDGYDLWLRYRPLPAAEAKAYAPHLTSIVAADSSMLAAARQELQHGVSGLLGRDLPIGTLIDDGALLIGTPAEQPAIKTLGLPLSDLGEEGYLIRSVMIDGHKVTVIAANSDRGVLYGVFRLLRQMQTGQSLDKLDISDAPKIKVRVLNHWDNLDGSVERGYAGASIWDWWRLPDLKDKRYTDYARANASIGINGTVVNNVNAKSVSLTAPYIAKAAALAHIMRPYGIRIYLSARFSSPIELGGLKTADPLDPLVRAWWQAKTDEIYKAIPDFGGFLVKANSEGQPGPGDYHRSHAEGANMLAEALAPHGGIVMWRAFVYSEHDATDRAKQAYSEFQPLDGQFADNVLVQIKNGPIDFQPREPFSPLLGAMPKTPEMMEFQITKEYTGQATHLVYLAPMFEETLKADTFAKGPGSTVARVIDGSLENHALTGMAGVANIGADRNWSGSDFDQANWYAFGRLAWNPEASSRDIATDWVRMTFSNDPVYVKPVVDMMMGSREAMADYMTPLGLHHQMATGHHYGPGPWVHELARPEWNPVYYNKADAAGIGFDRTKTGSDALAQYTPRAVKAWADPRRMDQRYLLWFHHLPWDYHLQDGHTLWDGLVMHYQSGVDQVAAMQATWSGLAPYIDAERFAAVSQNLTIQRREAQWWRDASISYFQSKSGLPLPAGYAAPPLALEAYEAMTFPYAPGQAH